MLVLEVGPAVLLGDNVRLDANLGAAQQLENNSNRRCRHLQFTQQKANPTQPEMRKSLSAI